jgi:hypothetical protein
MSRTRSSFKKGFVTFTVSPHGAAWPKALGRRHGNLEWVTVALWRSWLVRSGGSRAVTLDFVTKRVQAAAYAQLL